MGPMLHRLVIASLFVAATAHAQAPGEEVEGAGAPGNVAPQPAPVVVDNPCGGWHAHYHDVMANRWAVGLSIGSMSFAPKDTPDAKTDFAVGQLALRYRATYHLELELALGGGSEKLMDGTDGNREAQTVALGLRYRFLAAHDWNWWLMGAIGSVAIADKNASDQERQDLTRPMGELGIGVERRFEHFALQAELRAAGTGQTRAEKQAVMGTVTGGTTNVSTPPPPPTSSPTTDQLSGGSLTIGASYYF
jgi:hypothetical protein